MLSPTCDTEETLNNYKLLTSQFFKSRGGVSKTSSDLEAGKQKQNVTGNAAVSPDSQHTISAKNMLAPNFCILKNIKSSEILKEQYNEHL